MAIRWTWVMALLLLAGAARAEEKPALAGHKERLSYALGMDIGNTLRRQEVEIDQALFAEGLKDAIAGAKTRLNEQEVRTAVAELQALQRRELKRRQVAGGQRAKEAAAKGAPAAEPAPQPSK